MVTIRECTKEDFGRISKLLAQLWPEKTLDKPKLQQVFLRGLSSDSQEYICAVVENNIVGFGSFSVKNSLWQAGLICRVDELVVDKEYRGQGIGSKLLERITNMAKEKGCRMLELESAFDRTQAHKFYERNAFDKRAFRFSRQL